jgi:hypothetical protein
MKDNTQIAHTKFQKYTTYPTATGVIAKRKKTAKFFLGLSALFIFLIV